MNVATSRRRLGRLVAACLALAPCVLAGCSDSRDNAETAASEAPPPPPGTTVLAEFVAILQPRDHRITIAPAHGDGLGTAAQHLDDVPIAQDGTPGSGPRDTVELVTNRLGYGDECPEGFRAGTFCANVTLRHFYGRSLSNVFVQITSITDASGAPLPRFAAQNDDSAGLGLDDQLGLWMYTAPESTAPGVLGQAPYNAATRDWVFALPDRDAQFFASFRVVASLEHAEYRLIGASAPAIDACGRGEASSTTTVTTALPFPFTLYDTTTSTVTLSPQGVITFGGAPASQTGDNLSLPSPAAPRPAVFAFWDDLAPTPRTGRMCWQTLGAAPNRRFVITWSDLAFASTDVGRSSLSFSAQLVEGTNRVDLIYDRMTGASDERAAGGSATVGAQNAAGTAATSVFGVPMFKSGTAFSLLPSP